MQSLINGVWAEDFNYGYPYKFAKKSAPPHNKKYLPPEFTYSGEIIGSAGKSTATKYARGDFTLCYLDPSQEPNNIDSGSHGGAHSFAPYYLLYPTLTWGQTQVMTLSIMLFADGVLTFDRSFDGHTGDRFFLTVNGKERHTVTHTAGHHWTTDTISLRKGLNKISWVVVTTRYTPPTSRNGASVTATKPPVVPRYFRLCRFSISNVTDFPGKTGGYEDPPFYADFESGSTLTSNARRGARDKKTYRTNSGLYFKAKPFRADLVGGSSMTATTGARINAACFMLGESATKLFGGARVFHAGDGEGGVEISSTGALSVSIPIDTPQKITALFRPLTTFNQTMKEPIFVKGKPMLPRYRDEQAHAVSSAKGYSYTDPISPTSISHVLPVTPKYRWIATDIAGAEDSQVLDWPEHTSGTNPHWLATAEYAPTVHQHGHFDSDKDNVITYSRVVNFERSAAQHFYLSMPATAFPTTVTGTTAFQPYTWMFMAMLHPTQTRSPEGNTVLDSYLNGKTPSSAYAQAMRDDDEAVDTSEGDPYRARLRFNSNAAQLALAKDSRGLFKKWTDNFKPVVYTAVFDINKASIEAYGQNYHQRIAGPVNSGASNNNQGFLMGRERSKFHRHSSSTMSIMEVAFFNRVLSPAEVKKTSQYLMGVYQVERYH